MNGAKNHRKSKKLLSFLISDWQIPDFASLASLASRAFLDHVATGKATGKDFEGLPVYDLAKFRYFPAIFAPEPRDFLMKIKNP